jgi:hypothetical protein
MRVVLDTNIIVSAYLGGSLEAIIVAWKLGKFTLVVSAEIIDEYLSVLKRPKFKLELTEIEDFSALLLAKAEFVIPLEHVSAVIGDDTDNKFLDAAITGNANVIVSGDGHLLELKTFKEISIITPRDFLLRLNKS